MYSIDHPSRDSYFQQCNSRLRGNHHYVLRNHTWKTLVCRRCDWQECNLNVIIILLLLITQIIYMVTFLISYNIFASNVVLTAFPTREFTIIFKFPTRKIAFWKAMGRICRKWITLSKVSQLLATIVLTNTSKSRRQLIPTS